MAILQNNLVRLGLFIVVSALMAPEWASAQGVNGTPPPVAYTSVNELNGILTELQQTAQSMQADLQKARIEKWKTDGATKRQTQANVESLKRNLQAALPDMITELNNKDRKRTRLN